MKAQNIMRSLVIAIILMAGIAQVQAVNYQTKYKGTRYNAQSTASFGGATPAATFRSTSAFSSPEWAEQPMLNSDGSVNEGAYMSSRNNAPGGPRKIESIGNPDTDEKNDDGNVPLGDALIPLMLCMCAYAIYKVSRRRKEA